MKNMVETSKTATAKAQPAKATLAVLAAALAFSLAAAPAFALGPRNGAGCDSPCMRACAAAASKGIADMGASVKNACCRVASCEGFVDADGDSVCDNFGMRAHRGEGVGYGYGNGQRDGNGAGQGNGCGQGFAYADGDGVCDNRAAACACVDADADGACDTCGAAYPGGFVDTDGDGMCDNRHNGVRAGNGYGRGAGSGAGNGCGFGHGYGRGAC